MLRSDNGFPRGLLQILLPDSADWLVQLPGPREGRRSPDAATLTLVLNDFRKAALYEVAYASGKVCNDVLVCLVCCLCSCRHALRIEGLNFEPSNWFVFGTKAVCNLPKHGAMRLCAILCLVGLFERHNVWAFVICLVGCSCVVAGEKHCD